MRHGDISNITSLNIGFRCEDTLLVLPQRNLIDKLLNKVVGYNNAEIDPRVEGLMKYILFNTEYTVSLVIDQSTYEKAKKKIDSLQIYNQIVNVISGINEVSMMLFTGEMSYYVDNNDERRNCLLSKYALNFNEFNKLIERKINR